MLGKPQNTSRQKSLPSECQRFSVEERKKKSKMSKRGQTDAGDGKRYISSENQCGARRMSPTDPSTSLERFIFSPDLQASLLCLNGSLGKRSEARRNLSFSSVL